MIDRIDHAAAQLEAAPQTAPAPKSALELLTQ